MYKIIEKTKIWFSISLIIIFIGMGFAITKGFEWGIDFKGGTNVKIDMGKAFNKDEVEQIVKKYAEDESSNVLDGTILEVKSTKLNTETTNKMFSEIKEKYSLSENALVSQESIDPSLGALMKKNSIIAMVVALVLIMIYVAFRFEYKFGIAAILSLLHDAVITLGVYAIFRIPLDTAFIAAILTVLGYSINDTIVVFDRIRENQKYMRKNQLKELANASITQTFRRSIFTVLTVVITLVSVYIFVPDIRNFSFPLIIGILTGCYSSIFIATPIWYLLHKKIDKKSKKKMVTKKA